MGQEFGSNLQSSMTCVFSLPSKEEKKRNEIESKIEFVQSHSHRNLFPYFSACYPEASGHKIEFHRIGTILDYFFSQDQWYFPQDQKSI
jgi:hypothetical protein